MKRDKKKKTEAEYIYGAHAVLETLRSGNREVFEIFFSRVSENNLDLQEIQKLATVEIQSASDDRLQSLCATKRHQGVVAKVSSFPYRELSDIISQNLESNMPIMALDGVQDTGNLGNIIRACECLGAAGVIMPSDRSVGITPYVEKASSGATAYLPVARVKNLTRSLKELKSKGYWIYGAESKGRESLFNLSFPEKAVFVLGSEEKGIRRLIREQCDMSFHIPMRGAIDALNVSQACVVILSECLRRSLNKNITGRQT